MKDEDGEEEDEGEEEEKEEEEEVQPAMNREGSEEKRWT